MQDETPLIPETCLIPPALDARVAALWSDGHAAVDGPDVAFLHMCLSAARPEVIVEIGTATGLSTGALAQMQAGILGAPGQLRSYDLRDRLWFDESRAVGCLIPQVLGEDAAEVAAAITSVTGVTSADVAGDLGQGTVDFAFVDASHQHPWPILDTLMLLPLMRPGALIAHHDLQLYLDPGNNVGQGPKILFDQLDEANRLTARSLGCAPYRGKTPARAVRDNIFALRVPHDTGAFALQLAQGLALPWTLFQPVTPAQADQIRTRLRDLYPPRVAELFDLGLARDMRRRPPPPRKRGLLERAMGRLGL